MMFAHLEATFSWGVHLSASARYEPWLLASVPRAEFSKNAVHSLAVGCTSGRGRARGRRGSDAMADPDHFDECPGWRFEVEELSAGVYVVRAFDGDALRIERQGHDPEALVSRCRSEIMSGVPRR